jgi:hypothetical protein
MIKVARWWKSDGPRYPAQAMAYEVACACGRVVRGQRQARPQVIACPACGNRLFVLPASPLPPVGSPPGTKPGLPAGPRISARPWLLPLIAALVTLVIVICVLVFFLMPLLTSRTGPSSRTGDRERLTHHIDTGKQALADGHFRLAVKELAVARSLQEQHPQLLSTEDGHHLTQLYRQADTLAGREIKALDQILANWANLPERDWKVLFENNYRGKAMVFDLLVRRDAARQYEVEWRHRTNDEPVRLDVQDLTLLQQLPLENRQRLVLAARLSAIRREAGDNKPIWVVQLEPNSGVLLTDPGAVRASCPQAVDADLGDVLKRQAAWAADLP